jgi:diguanylate cyclase (GGDEF)-like protein
VVARSVKTQEKNWKEKYFDTLKELDEREHNWRRMEHILRAGVNRLAILSQDGHQELDKNLHKIRSLSRGNDNFDALEKAFGSLTKKTGTISDTDQSDVTHAIKTVSDLLPIDVDHRAAIDLHCKRSDSQKALKVLIKSVAVNLKQDASIDYSALATSLLSLLTQLESNESDECTLVQLREGISRAKTKRQWQIIIEKIIEQVRHELTEIHDKKNRLLLFIKQLAQQLSGLEKLALSATTNMVRAKHRATDMNNSLSSELMNLSQEVVESDDTPKTKRRVSHRLTSALDSMQDYFKQESEYFDEAERINRSLSGKLQAAQQEADELRNELEQSRQAQFLDTLTEVPNRHAYEERLSLEVDQHLRAEQPLVFVLWDIDFFKLINDNYGHKAGDVVLKMVAQLLAKSIGQSDFMARIGGEEFVMLLSNTTIDEAVKFVNMVREKIAKSGFNHRGDAVCITASCGLTCMRAGDDVEALYERADDALYRAKREGRNCCVSDAPGDAA